jgi:hypothetical protein
VIAHCLASPVDLAEFDVNEIDRRIGRRLFAGNSRSFDVACKGSRWPENQQEGKRRDGL